MTADVTVPAESVRRLRRRNLAFGLSVRILGMVIAAVMTAEILLFLPSIGRFRMAYLDQLIESGTLAALALDATPDNMVTEEVKRALLNNARVDTVVLVEPNKPKRALMTIEPRPTMPSYNLKDEGLLPLIWDALAAMTHDGARYIRVGGESMRLPHAMVWIIVDELPMRIAMYSYATRILVLSIIIALFTAFLLYLALRWLVIRPLQDLSADMTAFRREPEEPGTERPSTKRNDEIGVVDREFQNLQRELRASLRQKSRLAEIGAATNKINHDRRDFCPTGWRAVTTSARGRWRRPSSTPSTGRRVWPATPSSMSATGRRPGLPKSSWPTWSTRWVSRCRNRAKTAIPTSSVTGSMSAARIGRCGPIAICSTGCSSISAATPSKPARPRLPCVRMPTAAISRSTSSTTAPACPRR